MEYLVIIGAALQFYGIAVYALETIKGNTKPNRITWLLWALAPLIASCAAFSDGIRWSHLPFFVSGLGSLLVFFASFINKKSYWRLKKFDYLCGFFSILALLMWYMTKDPFVAILFAIVSDFFATIPTLAKAWKYPETENITPYITGLFGLATSFSAIKNWSLIELSFPVYTVSMGSALLFAVIRKKLKL